MRFLKFVLLAVVLLCAQALAGAHAIEHAQEGMAGLRQHPLQPAPQRVRANRPAAVETGRHVEMWLAVPYHLSQIDVGRAQRQQPPGETGLAP